MSTTLRADEMGNLHLPPSLLPDPEPLATYRVEDQNGHIVISKESLQNTATEPFWKTATAEERAEAFRQWASKPRPPVGLSDYAVSRESIYD